MIIWIMLITGCSLFWIGAVGIVIKFYVVYPWILRFRWLFASMLIGLLITALGLVIGTLIKVGEE
jgi:hypothetical protein